MRNLIQATSRAIHHAFSKYLEIARLVFIPKGTPRRVTWPDVSARAHRLNKGHKIEAVKTLLQMREQERL